MRLASVPMARPTDMKKWARRCVNGSCRWCMHGGSTRADGQDYHTLPFYAVRLLINKLHRDGRFHLLHEAIHAGDTLVLVTLLHSAYRLPRGDLLLPADLQTEILTEQNKPDKDIFCHDGDSPQYPEEKANPSMCLVSSSQLVSSHLIRVLSKCEVRTVSARKRAADLLV